MKTKATTNKEGRIDLITMRAVDFEASKLIVTNSNCITTIYETSITTSRRVLCGNHLRCEHDNE